MTARSLWGDRGTGPDPVKIKANQITCFYEDIRDATKASVAANAKLCGASGVYAAWNWPETAALNGAQFADWVSNELKRCDLGNPDQPRVDLNSENDDQVYVRDMLVRWRQHRQSRTTGWTPQAHKAGIYSGIASFAIRTALVTVKPQCYEGEPIRRVESASEVLAWQAVGCPLVEPMLWAEFLGDWWQGTVFIAGRLP